MDLNWWIASHEVVCMTAIGSHASYNQHVKEYVIIVI